jgi:hypothetical protein
MSLARRKLPAAAVESPPQTWARTARHTWTTSAPTVDDVAATVGRTAPGAPARHRAPAPPAPENAPE